LAEPKSGWQKNNHNKTRTLEWFCLSKSTEHAHCCKKGELLGKIRHPSPRLQRARGPRPGGGRGGRAAGGTEGRWFPRRRRPLRAQRRRGAAWRRRREAPGPCRDHVGGSPKDRFPEPRLPNGWVAAAAPGPGRAGPWPGRAAGAYAEHRRHGPWAVSGWHLGHQAVGWHRRKGHRTSSVCAKWV